MHQTIDILLKTRLSKQIPHQMGKLYHWPDLHPVHVATTMGHVKMIGHILLVSGLFIRTVKLSSKRRMSSARSNHANNHCWPLVLAVLAFLVLVFNCVGATEKPQENHQLLPSITEIPAFLPFSLACLLAHLFSVLSHEPPPSAK